MKPRTMKTTAVTLFLSLLLAAMPAVTSAMPAYPKRIQVAAGNKTVHILLRGDENHKYAIDDDGYTLLPAADGWHYATQDAAGQTIASGHRLVAREDRDGAMEEFLRQVPKGLVPTLPPTVARHAPGPAGEAPRLSPAVGSRRVLIILMQFRDRSFVKSQSDFERLFNEEDYRDDGAMGSVRDFYRWASYGQLDLHCDITGPYTSQHDMAYYGDNTGAGAGDQNPYALFQEAIGQAAGEISLADYDADGDGYVDNIHIIYAGYGEEAGASPSAIWAHEMTFRTITVQGMKINKYSCAPELRGNRGTGISRIGPHCHEIGHALGAMDYYDTNYETGGSYLGTGQWDIMAQGSWNNDGIQPADFNPYVKIYDYGWTEPQTLQADESNTIGPAVQKGDIYRIDTETAGDYFLLENRDGSGFHAAEPGRGLLIFHIGPQLAEKAQSNTINATHPQQCYTVCASATSKHPSASAASYGSINSSGCPYPGSSGKQTFSDESTPAAWAADGRKSGISLSDIRLADGNVTLFCARAGSTPPEPEPESDCIWQEDFELQRMPDGWGYGDLRGLGLWSVVTKLSTDDTPQGPAAASGRGFAKFTATGQSQMGRQRTEGLLSTTPISLLPGSDYLLSVKARRYARLKDACDTLDIGLVASDGTTEPVLKRAIVEEHQWSEFSTQLPKCVGQFWLTIRSSTDFGSILFVDDFRIGESGSLSGIGAVEGPAQGIVISQQQGALLIESSSDAVFSIHRMDGTCLQRGRLTAHTAKTVVLPQGLYLLRSGTLSAKILIR